MREEEHLSILIGKVYDAALDSSLGHDVVEEKVAFSSPGAGRAVCGPVAAARL
jgi:hypothetical protein